MADAPEGEAVRASDRQVGAWLFTVAAMVFAMVVLGGLTRLTDSGLSITQWDVISGVLPPLSDAAWERAFAAYRETSEYQLQNRGMTLGEFQFIFWWEWAHRLLGRLLGVAFVVPLVVFALRGALRGWMAPALLALLVLGGAQGGIGWWMVTSGLVDRVDVSHYRLAIHLGMAFALLAALVWVALNAWTARPVRPRLSWLAALGLAAMALIFLQVLLGALVAGLDAGRIHVGWPLYAGGELLPPGYGSMEPFWRDALENRASVQFHHRMVGYLVALDCLTVAFAARSAGDLATRRLGAALGALALGQAALGVWTLVSVAPLALSAAHQAMAAALFACAAAFSRQASSAQAQAGAPPRREAARAT